jgi:hypothetical protein
VFGREQFQDIARKTFVFPAEVQDFRVAFASSGVIGHFMKHAFDALPTFGIHQVVEHTMGE